MNEHMMVLTIPLELPTDEADRMRCVRTIVMPISGISPENWPSITAPWPIHASDVARIMATLELWGPALITHEAKPEEAP